MSTVSKDFHETAIALERVTIAQLRADVARWTVAATEARMALEALKTKADADRLSLQGHADALANALGAIRSRDLWADGLDGSSADEREARMVQIAGGALKKHSARQADALSAALARGAK